MSNPKNGQSTFGPATAADLQARVDDLEQCLAELCESLGKAATAYGYREEPATLADLTGLCKELQAIIQQHKLGS